MLIDLQTVAVPIPEKIIGTSLVTSLAVFGARVMAKEFRAILGDLFQIVEFTIRWWIYIRKLSNELATAPTAMIPAGQSAD